MKLKKLIAGLTAVVCLMPMTTLISGKQTEEVSAASINTIAKKNSYVGTSYLYKILATAKIKYNKFYTKNKLKYRNHGKPDGIVIHETADPGATAMNEAIYFNREWNKMYAYVHAFVDHKQVIQMMTPNYGVWGAGPMANDRFVQVELCEESTRNNFAKSVNNDAIYAAKILHRFNLKPTNATHNGKGTVWSHAAVSKFLGGTDHGDPVGYFAKWGYSMDDFFNLIKYYYNLQAAETVKKTVAPKKITNPSVNITQVPKVKFGKKTVMHDAAVYNSKGKKAKNVAFKPAGTVVDVTAAKKIGKRNFYQIGKNEYILAGNIDGTMRKLKHNSYIYDTVGLSSGTTKLMKNSKVRTYGGRVTIAGEKYYAISATQFVKADNF